MRVLSEMETEAVVGGHINGQGDPMSQSASGGSGVASAASIGRAASSMCGAGNVKSATYSRTETPREVSGNRGSVSGSGRGVTEQWSIECKSGNNSGSSDTGDSSDGDDSDSSDSGSDS